MASRSPRRLSAFLGQPVEVEWVDAYRPAEMPDEADARSKGISSRSCGYLVWDQRYSGLKESIAIAQTAPEPGEPPVDLLIIPRGCVRRVRQLRGGG